MKGKRASFLYAKEKLKTIEVAIEIGVREGANAKELLDNGVKFLYLVDPYIPGEETWDDENPGKIRRVIVDQKLQNFAKNKMLKLLEPYKDRS